MDISIVIITKNEEKNISDCLEGAYLISKDVIVVDTGSSDKTVQIASQKGAKVVVIEWNGYGNARNEAANNALNNWIFALDADERITPTLADNIKRLKLTDNKVLYGCKRESFLVQKKIKHGDWGRDKVYRLYNKQITQWDLVSVHENINVKGLTKQLIGGSLLHYTMDSLETYKLKKLRYAQLSAEKYFSQHKKATFVKRFLSPMFVFIQTYLLRLGFLDGKEGFIIAKYSAQYVWTKYNLLNEMNLKK